MAHHGEADMAVNEEGMVAGGEGWLYIYTEESDLSSHISLLPNPRPVAHYLQ